MFTKILVAYDGSEGAKQALDKVADLKACGIGEVHVVAVGRLPEYAETEDEVDEAREQAEAFYKTRLEQAAALLRERGLGVQTHLAFGKPGEQILRVAGEIKASLLVVGVHPHSALRRRVLGGCADKLVDHAECSVLVVR